MFINLETGALKELVDAQAASRWIAVATAFLLRNDRNVAVGKTAEAIRWYAYDLEAPEHPLALSLYAEALKRMDFYSVALALIQAAEAADPSLVESSIDEEPLAA